MHIHAFNEFELTNALRLLVFLGKISPQKRQAWLENFATDKGLGLLRFTLIDPDAVLRRAETMSALHTETGGNRSYDILLVATAKILGATEFWSFDGRQRALAAAEGLTVGP